VELSVALDGSAGTGGGCNTAAVAVAGSAVEGVVNLVGELASGGGGVSVVNTRTSTTELLLVQTRGVCASLSGQLVALGEASATGSGTDLTRLVAKTGAVGESLAAGKTSTSKTSTSTST
jgi:hypothetical protein